IKRDYKLTKTISLGSSFIAKKRVEDIILDFTKLKKQSELAGRASQDDTTKKEMLGITVVTPHWAVTNVELAMKIILLAIYGKNSSVIHDITHCCTNTKYHGDILSWIVRSHVSVDGNGRDSIKMPFFVTLFTEILLKLNLIMALLPNVTNKKLMYTTIVKALAYFAIMYSEGHMFPQKS
ncbi:hypothetical protein ACJX0J_008738, partial [Zea mays]